MELSLFLLLIISSVSLSLSLETDQAIIEVNVKKAVNIHCYKGFEQECHPYVVVNLEEEKVDESTNVIQCSRNPKWEYSLLFSHRYCLNRLNVLLFQYFSTKMVNTFLQYPEVGYTLNTDNIGNMERNSLRGKVSLDLSRIPPGNNSFWIMLEDSVSVKREYLLPTCLKLEINWKPSDCKEYSTTFGYTQIDGEYLRNSK